MLKVMAQISPCFVSEDWQKYDTIKIVLLPATLLGLDFLGAVISKDSTRFFWHLFYWSVNKLLYFLLNIGV